MGPLRRFAPPPADLAVALALAVWAAAEGGADKAVGIPAALLMTLPLTWRRTAPLAVACLVAGGFALQAAQSEPPESLATLIAILLATYSAASAPRRLHAAAGVAVLLAGAIAETALAGDGDYLFIVILLAAAAIAGRAMALHSKQAEKEREREAALAVAAERERIAREMHDSVAHAVSLMVVQASAAETGLGPSDPTAEALQRIRATGQDAVADLGRMVGLLRSENGNAAVPGIGEPSRLVESFRDAGLDVMLTVEGEPRTLPTGLDGAAYRIVQEALTNALKYGGDQASLSIAYEPEAVRLAIRNDVVAGGANGTGHGLIGMRERARLYGGELRIEQAGGQFAVEATLPTS